MNQNLHWMITLAVVMLVGVAGTLYFRLVVMRRDETTAGIQALAAMSWREFIHLLLDALALRGYARVFDREAPSGDDDYTLERDGKHWLLSCKHGSSYVLGYTTMAELANDIRLANAAGGILATQGRIDAQARQDAGLQRIELLDGPTLWPELRGLIEPGQLAAIVADAGRKAQRRTLLSWLLALVAGLATWLLLPASDTPVATPPAASVATTPEPQPAPQQTSPAAPPTVPASDSPIAAPPEPPPLEVQREDVADAISTLPMVDRAVWSTQSTIQVYLLDASTDAMPQICPLIERYDTLAASRVQLTPPAGSGLPVRFRQCRTY